MPNSQEINSQVAGSQKAPGRVLLLIAGIGLVVYNGWYLLTDIPLFLFGAQDVQPSLQFWTNVLNSIFAIFVGIMGIIYCGNAKQAKLLLTLAIISLAVYILFFVIHFGMIIIVLGVRLAFYLGVIFILPLVINVSLRVLYIIGAVKNLRFIGKEEWRNESGFGGSNF